MLMLGRQMFGWLTVCSISALFVKIDRDSKLPRQPPWLMHEVLKKPKAKRWLLYSKTMGAWIVSWALYVVCNDGWMVVNLLLYRCVMY